MAELAYIENQDTDDWDTLLLGGEFFPGVPTISGAVERNLDVKSADGSDGATLTDKGYRPAELVITLRMASLAEWRELQGKLPKIHPRRKGGLRNPLEIRHPAVNILGITQVYVHKIGVPTVDAAKIITLPITAIEYTTQPKPVHNAAGTSAAGDTVATDSKLFESTAADLADSPDTDPTAGDAVSLGLQEAGIT